MSNYFSFSNARIQVLTYNMFMKDIINVNDCIWVYSPYENKITNNLVTSTKWYQNIDLKKLHNLKEEIGYLHDMYELLWDLVPYIQEVT